MTVIMRKKVLLKTAAMAFLLLAVMMIFCSCGSNGSRVCDNAGLFTESEIAEIEKNISAAEKHSLCDYFIITKVDASGGMYNSNYELKNHELEAAGVDKYADNTVLLILTDGKGKYCYHIYTHGDSYDAIDDREFDGIWDSIGGINDGNFFEPSLKWLDMSAAAYNNTNSVVGHYVSHILFAFFLSLVAAGVTVGVIAAKYKMKIKPTNYPVDKYCKLDLTVNEDVFKGTFVTKRRIPKNNGGSRGGHGGGGGVSFGGSRARR